MKHQTAKSHYTIHDVRQMLGKGLMTIHKMIKDGRLPEPSRDGRMRVWKKVELDRWIKLEKHLN